MKAGAPSATGRPARGSSKSTLTSAARRPGTECVRPARNRCQPEAHVPGDDGSARSAELPDHEQVSDRALLDVHDVLAIGSDADPQQGRGASRANGAPFDGDPAPHVVADEPEAR